MPRTHRILALLLTSVAVVGLAGCPHRHHRDRYPPPPPIRQQNDHNGQGQQNDHNGPQSPDQGPQH